MAETEEHVTVAGTYVRDFDSDAAVRATTTNESHTYTEDITRDAQVPGSDDGSQSRDSSARPGSADIEGRTALESMLTEQGTSQPVSESSETSESELEELESVEEKAVAGADANLEENSTAVVVPETEFPAHDAAEETAEVVPAAPDTATPVAEHAVVDAAAISDEPGAPDVVVDENRASAQEVTELPHEEFTQLARSKTVKNGPFIAAYTDETPAEAIIKLKRSKKDDVWLISIDPAGAEEGAFVLSVSSVAEFAKVNGLAVAIDLPTLDVFTISRAVHNGRSEPVVSPRKANGGHRHFGRSRSGKEDPNLLYSYFYPAVKGFDRNQTHVSAVRSGAPVKLPPIQFKIPSASLKEEGSSRPKLRIHWKARDVEARKKNNKKFMQFLYPKIPDY